MVSPPYKGGYGVDAQDAITATEEQGNRVEYFSFGTFGGAAGAPSPSGYMAQRTADGWSSTSLIVPASISQETFGADVSRSLSQSVTLGDTGPNHGSGVDQNETDVFLLHDTSLPDTEEYFEVAGYIHPFGEEFLSNAGGISYDGASSDLCHLVFESDQPVLPEAQEALAPHSELYELDHGCDGTSPAVRVIGLKNDGKLISRRCQDYLGSPDVHSNAIADGGSEIYFEANVETGENPVCGGGKGENQIFVRLGGSRTVEVSRAPSVPCDISAAVEVPCEDAAARKGSTFAAASEDGSRVFFTTAQSLVGEDGDSGNDVYMASVGCPGGPEEVCETRERQLTGMSQVSHDPRAGQAANVLGVVRVAPDGSRVYFVAEGDLLTVSEEEALVNEGRGVPVQGAANLYVYDVDSKTTSFVAYLCSGPELSGEVESGRCGSNLDSRSGRVGVNDSKLWTVSDAETSGQDARYLLFTSYGQLVPGDTDTAADVYRYDAVTGRLNRVSIEVAGYDTNGNDDSFDATIRSHASGSDGFGPPVGVSEKYELANRAMTEDGSRVVFMSAGPLSPDVVNHTVNVYEWHEEADGGEGEVALISTGTSNEPDEEAMITPSGQDIFFTSSQDLVEQDTDGAADIYDARHDGGFAPAPARPLECIEACQGPLSAPAALLVPGSVSQQPGENLVPSGGKLVTSKKPAGHAKKKAKKKAKEPRKKGKARKAVSGTRGGSGR